MYIFVRFNLLLAINMLTKSRHFRLQMLFLFVFFFSIPSVLALSSPSLNTLSTSSFPNKNEVWNKFGDLGNNNTSSDHSFANSTSAEHELLCADGKGPLLEGEERTFPCAGECPGGFDCEFPQGRDKGGICCPNLSELYRLYKERSEEEEEEGTEREEGDQRLRVPKKGTKLRKEGKKRAKAKGMVGVDAMALLEQHYGDGIARIRPPADFTTQPTPAEGSNLLVSSRTVEIRRSQPKLQTSQQDFVLRPRNSQFASKTQSAQNKQRNNDISGEEYSCRRQKLELFCEDRRRQTQFVLRWYAKDRICVSYPWGYCSGKPVASDPTIRTREECEMLCSAADPLDSNNKNVLFGVERKGGADGGGQRITSKDADNGAAVPLDLSKSEEALDAIPTATAEQNLVESVRGGGGEAAPLDVAPGAHNLEAPSARETNPTASSAEFSEFLLMEQRRQPKKRCLKVTPYRSMCPDGMPSQFTLRWHFRGDACFAYPYGYCHGESVMAEEPIKTENECLRTCTAGGVQQRQQQQQQTNAQAEESILEKQ